MTRRPYPKNRAKPGESVERRLARYTPAGAVDECWHWLGALHTQGYGMLKWGDRVARAHRLAYELVNGTIPDGMVIDHTCHNADSACAGGASCLHRRCVNPAHLEAVTVGINTRRSPLTVTARNAAVTHCPQGHPYDEANTCLSGGGRLCRTCYRERQRVRTGYYERRQASA